MTLMHYIQRKIPLQKQLTHIKRKISYYNALIIVKIIETMHVFGIAIFALNVWFLVSVKSQLNESK